MAVIVGIICVPFALWGINSYFGNSANVAVAEVNDVEIDLKHFQRRYNQSRQQFQQLFGGESPFDEATQKKQVLDQMIEQILLEQAAASAGMRISDEQVATGLNAMDYLKKDGMFASDLYTQLLQMSGMSAAEFEARLRATLLNDQLRQGLVVSEFVTDPEADRADSLRNQKRKIAFVTFPAEAEKIKSSITDEEVKSYYHQHQNEFMNPEMVKVAYLRLSIDELAERQKIDEEALKQYYDDHVADYTVAEERSAKHILVKVAGDAGEEEVTAAKKKAEAFLKLARDGKALEEIAEKHFGADKAAEFGELETLRKGIMEPELDDVLFSMSEGEISELVRTKDGFHIIQLSKIKPASTKSFTAARDEIEKAYRRELAEDDFYEDAEALSNLAFESPDSLEPAAEALNLPIQHSKFFSRKGGKGLVSKKEIIEAAFSPEVLDGHNSEPLEIGTNTIVVLRLAERKPAAVRPLAEVRETIIESLAREKAGDAAKKRGEQLLEKLRTGADRQKLAAEEGVKWEEKEAVTRDDPDVNRAVLREAFSLARPQQGQASYGVVQTGDGDYIVVAVAEVVEQGSTDEDENAAKQGRERLVGLRAAIAWRDFVNELRRNADIRIFPENL